MANKSIDLPAGAIFSNNNSKIAVVNKGKFIHIVSLQIGAQRCSCILSITGSHPQTDRQRSEAGHVTCNDVISDLFP